MSLRRSVLATTTVVSIQAGTWTEWRSGVCSGRERYGLQATDTEMDNLFSFRLKMMFKIKAFAFFEEINIILAKILNQDRVTMRGLSVK